MFLRQWVRKGVNGKPDRVNLDIVESYRDENRKCKSRVVKHIGYLDEFKDLYEDPIAHFKEEAVRMTEEAKKAPVSVEFSVNLTEEVDSTKGFVKNYGHIAASRIYHELRIDEFLNKYQRSTKLQSNLNSVLRALTFSRIIQPASKMSSYQDVFSSLFDPVNFSDEFMYRSLGHLGDQCDNIQAWINDSVTELYGRDLSVATYDLSNYFYEIDNEDDFRKRGGGKEHRPQPITQMGLMQDKNRIPIRFDLYKGNTLDSKTLIPAMDKNRKSLKLARLVLVADRGIISAANVGEMDASGNGYIFGMSVRKASEDFQAFVLDPSGYRSLDRVATANWNQMILVPDTASSPGPLM